MRIGFLSYEYFGSAGGGGIGTYVRLCAKMLAARGHSVVVFTSAGDASDEHCLNGVEVHSTRSTRANFAETILPIFERWHARQTFDVIEGPEYGADASAVARRFPDLPLVVKLHTPTFLINEINELYRPWSWKA